MVTLNLSVLSVHYNTPDVNDSLVYCNGKYTQVVKINLALVLFQVIQQKILLKNI